MFLLILSLRLLCLGSWCKITLYEIKSQMLQCKLKSALTTSFEISIFRVSNRNHWIWGLIGKLFLWTGTLYDISKHVFTVVWWLVLFQFIALSKFLFCESVSLQVFCYKRHLHDSRRFYFSCKIQEFVYFFTFLYFLSMVGYTCKIREMTSSFLLDKFYDQDSKSPQNF